MKAFRATYTPTEGKKSAMARIVLIVKITHEFEVIFIDNNGDLASDTMGCFRGCNQEDLGLRRVNE